MGMILTGAQSKRQLEFDKLSKDVRSYFPSIEWIINSTEAPWPNGTIDSIVKQLKFSLFFPGIKIIFFLEFKNFY